MAENKKTFVKNSVKKNFDKKNQKKSFIKKNTNFAKKETAKYWYPDDPYLGKEFIEYKMPKAAMLDLLNNRNKVEEKIDPQKYLCDYVNNECGLLGYCVRVIEG